MKSCNMGCDAYAGLWDFDGSCAPSEGGKPIYHWQDVCSFSLGCFQWERKKDGSGLKRGKVRKRFYGTLGNSGPAYARARSFCEGKNAGDDVAADDAPLLAAPKP